jgi:molecular chaperone DnaJ
MSKNYYQILGLKKEATAEEIKKAFHRLAHQYHPDKGGNEAKFKEINEAYQVLSDKEKRAQYDQFGTAAPGWDFSWSWGAPGGVGNTRDDFGEAEDEAEFGFGGLGDLFEEFFGLGATQSRGRRPGGARRGKDIEIDLMIQLEEVLRNQEKEISLEKFVACQRCQGSGGEPGSPVKECFTCRGAGEVQQIRRTIFGSLTAQVTCPECRGEGKKPENPCNVCQGEGRIKNRQTVRVFVPSGVDQNQIIKVESAGDAGRKGGRSGDLFARIILKPHPVFARRGDDLFTLLEVPFAKMVLGGKMELKDLEGKNIVLEIPAASRTGKILRLSHKGLPHFQSSGRGHLYVELDVKIPKKVSQKQKGLLEKLLEIEN